MSTKSCIVFVLIFQWAVLASGQTAEDLAAKYPVVSAFKVRPGVLMTAHYAEDAQVCEMLLERHYTPDQADAEPTISPKLQNELIAELVPDDQRGSRTSKWLGNSFVEGGITHEEREFENVMIELDGTVYGGVQIIEIHWKKRPCAPGKSGSFDFHKTHAIRRARQ